MAGIKAKGIEGLQLSMQEVAAIPREVVLEMLKAGGAVVVRVQKQKLRSLGITRTGRLAGSIEAFPKTGGRGDFEAKVVVYPAGRHHTYQRRQVTKTYARSKSGRTYTKGGGQGIAYNNELAFIYEYGAPRRRIKARYWMKKANEEAAAETVAAEMQVYDRWLSSKDL